MTKHSKIFFEAYKLNNLYSGLGQFCFHLLDAFHQMHEHDIRVGINKPTQWLNSWTFATTVLKPQHRYWGVPLQHQKVFHATHQDTVFFPRKKSVPVVLTVHDLNFLYKYSPFRSKLKLHHLQRKINRADCITAVSEFTASQLRAHVNLKSKPVHVIYNGNALQQKTNTAQVHINTQAPFLLFMGTLTERKQVHLLIDMMQYIPDLALCLAGTAHSTYATLLAKQIVQLKLQSRVFILGEVSESQRLWLYQNCEALVFPSVAEGFGLPVIEAMSIGKPVFISNVASLPEIAGSHAYVWNTLKSPEMAELVNASLQTMHMPLNIQQRIAHAAQFSWNAAALKYLSIYQNYM